MIHATAIVDEGAQIGADTSVWHWAHVCGGAKIGDRCSLGQNVFVGNKVVIGNNVKIQNNVSVYDNVTLEDDVFCGPSMVFTNVYNPRSAVSRKDEYRNTLVKRGVTMGANCTIVCGTTIGEYAFVGAGAVINRDVKPYALMVGVPAKQIGWISQHGERLDLPLVGQAQAMCTHSGQKYVLTGAEVHLFEEAELIIEHGQAKLISPVYLKSTANTKLVIDIDEKDVAPTRDWLPDGLSLPQRKLGKPEASGSPMQAIFNEILGEQAIERTESSIGDDHQLLMESIEERYFGR